jgi:hypothetical protein
MLEFFMGSVVAAGVASVGAAVTVGVAATAAKAAIAGIVELAKSSAKQAAKYAAEYALAAKKSSATLEAEMKTLFTMNIYPALSLEIQQKMANDSTLRPFIQDGKIRMPRLGEVYMDGNYRMVVWPGFLERFIERVSYFVPPSTDAVRRFGASFFLWLRGEG